MPTSYRLVEIHTPKNYRLRGLYAGKQDAASVAIFLHGLTGSVFGSSPLIEALTKRLNRGGIGLLAMNNRGHDVVSRVKKIDRRKKSGYRSFPGGGAHEVFEDCVDDIEGMVAFAGRKGAVKIFLIGHSTGCQKSVFYLSRRGKQKKVSGVVLLAPMSDYSIGLKLKKDKLAGATRLAKKLVAENKSHDLLPKDAWGEDVDAQRFLSLFTPASSEEIFTYWQPERKSSTFQKIKIPTLALFAEKDRYRDRPTAQIVSWFESNQRSSAFRSVVIPDADHSFAGLENQVANQIGRWLDELERG
jgi:pimeloyl-ACP methyl ester carboxylesterase